LFATGASLGTQDTGHGDIIIISTSSGTRPPSGSQNNEGHPAETTQKQIERERHRCRCKERDTKRLLGELENV